MPEVPDDDAEFPLSPAAEHEEVVKELVQLLIARHAIKFGQFDLRRKKTSYWIDAGALYAGHDFYCLGRAIAFTMRHHFGEDTDVVFASCLDAMTIAVAACQYYALLSGFPCEFGYFRPLDVVGEGPAMTIGGRLGENRKVVIVEDVLTSGDSVRQAIKVVKSTGATIVGVCSLFDRCEREKGVKTQVALARETGLKIVTCATAAEIAKLLPEEAFTHEQRESLSKKH